MANAGQYVLALRGTLQTGSDLAITDVGDIVHDGLAHHQIVDLYNFWQQITAKKGESYQVAKIIDAGLGTIWTDATKEQKQDIGWLGKGYFVDSGDLKKIIFEDSDKVYKEGDDRAKGLGFDIKNLVVTGHSLGGHLSAAFSRLFPDVVEHAYMINGAGYGNTFNPVNYIGTSAPVNKL